MQTQSNTNVSNLSSRKLWDILHDAAPAQRLSEQLLLAAEEELLARKHYSNEKKFHRPH
jgi:hypothetical protein